jgi:hypothetical protein
MLWLSLDRLNPTFRRCAATKNVRNSGRSRLCLRISIDTPDMQNYPKKRRLCTRLADTIADAPVEGEDPNSFETFKRNVCAVIDRMLSEMNRQFSDYNMKTMKSLDSLALMPSSENFLNENKGSQNLQKNRPIRHY